ncbi:unnamed protein product [Schistocephalus solidus]|uniref:Uncharacterized protein n=1 Tax=Schistocephalus solidus TaxID=70667 RepID=A0A183SKL9_SCHSO|nr:unnamed protein product [Schistocephalus solidus]
MPERRFVQTDAGGGDGGDELATSIRCRLRCQTVQKMRRPLSGDLRTQLSVSLGRWLVLSKNQDLDTQSRSHLPPPSKAREQQNQPMSTAWRGIVA